MQYREGEREMAKMRKFVVTIATAICLATALFSLIPFAFAQPPPEFNFGDDFSSGNFNLWTTTEGKPKVVKDPTVKGSSNLWAEFKGANKLSYCTVNIPTGTLFTTQFFGTFQFTKSDTFFVALTGKPYGSQIAPETFLYLGVTGSPPKLTVLAKDSSGAWQEFVGNTVDLDQPFEFMLLYGGSHFLVVVNWEWEMKGDTIRRDLTECSIGVLQPSHAKVYADYFAVYSWLD